MRQAVRNLLEASPAFHQLTPDAQRSLAQGMVRIGEEMVAPRGDVARPTPQVRALAGDGSSPHAPPPTPKFDAQGAREGAAVAGALLQQVNFPEFCAGLINGVFHSIVQSSIEQMEAYAKLVADVSKSLNDFRDENTTQNQGRDHLVQNFPDVFQLQTGGDDPFAFGSGSLADAPAAPQPRVVVREGIDEPAAIARINQSLPLEKPIESLDDELAEALLVPAARTQIASGRQQLLATMVMLGINRIVVTDGELTAKVMYDFQARDNFKFKNTAQAFDYGEASVNTEQVANGAIVRSGPSTTMTRMPDGRVVEQRRDASFYTKGDYKSVSQPLITLQSVTQTQGDAQLTAKASLAGTMKVKFKSDYLPLEKLANPESIAAIQMNAQPGMVKTLAARPASGAPSTPAAAPSPAPAA
ncbi:hypothetical protein FW784_08130 [Lysobacter lacus]|uniref:Uncharacterized protein n=1 Tax=Cognatilysobacter lacus TaxID=1643323 RepID=A0A5D8Z408_9GAMM|nr:hypothetical protein FW784_08130 [Lysobacter lacus]